jgi:hypothetical protein
MEEPPSGDFYFEGVKPVMAPMMALATPKMKNDLH